MISILLTDGKYAVVDDEDAVLAAVKWRLHNHGYACRSGEKPKSTILLHRVIAARMGLDLEGKMVDHIDQDRLNNRRLNIRAATMAENQRNRSAQRNSSSGYKNIRWRERYKKWTTHITVNKKQIHIGHFSTLQEAVEAQAEAARRHHKEFARP